ncbi:MAG: hypothetical protein A2126_04220 [Candidatus Woykebacteria bacterium GWB1_45_5]|uniref:Uncharacterized protein n=2 Tax=Candidatus Woykeibacteriota TaxID=1817899 RepID=A0A1G1W1F6_9BACT|nr:MAG: hypothetical protein A2113_02025 [Candidatus Woykebacteria bacterium GWA1_44_8]OGY22347.1 MAG: hypothetical protein A2126_04220 [Candidatus Woykebacteria bacterium GWB1_45_5]
MVRRIIVFGLFFSLLTLLSITPLFADFAGVSCPAGFKFCDSTIGTILTALLTPVFTIAAMVAFLFLLWGGLRYMLARGDPKAVDAARSTVTNAIIGLLIILFAATIFYIVGQTFKLWIFTPLSLVPTAYAADGVNIGCTVNLGGVDLCKAFPNLGSLFTRIAYMALILAGVVFLAMIIWGGFRYINAGGDPKSAADARQTLTNAGIGLLIIVFSFFIIEVATHLAGVKSIFSP